MEPLKVSIPQIEGDAGATLDIPINLSSDVADVGSIDIILTYDAGLLTATAVDDGPIKGAGLTSLANANAPGKVVIGAFSLDGSGKLIPAGAIATVTFEIKADAPGGSTSDLILEEITFIDPAGAEITLEVSNGELMVPEKENIPPVANPGVAEIAALGGEEIQFDGSASADPDGEIVAFNWDFGDGESAEGDKVSHTYAEAGEYTVTLTVTDNQEATGTATVKVTVSLPEVVITEHEDGSPMLVFEGNFTEENIAARCNIDIWTGEFVIEAGQYLEYQIVMYSYNPSFNAGIDLHTTADILLSATDATDVAGLSASPNTDLSASIKVDEQDVKHAARDQWYHRKISLDALAGETVNKIMLGTESETNGVGLMRIYVDNIQITDGEYRLLDVYIDNDTILDGKQEATEGECEGMENAKVLSGVTAIGVHPAGKLPFVWGRIKAAR